MSGLVENPFEPPVGETGGRIDSTEEIRRRVSRPGTALLIMGSIHAVFPTIGVIHVLLFGSYMPWDVFLINLLTNSGVAIGAVLISIGGAKMAFLESYKMARLGAILACIPVISPFILWGIPFGIWALVLLRDPAVKAAFAKAQTED
ncbi:MAG: hypothetical protein ACKOAU_17780 [Pirellula sp.]